MGLCGTWQSCETEAFKTESSGTDVFRLGNRSSRIRE